MYIAAVLTSLLWILNVFVAGGRIKRIVGGMKTEVNRYPWQVYIEIKDRSGQESRCGGSLISDRYVLTAAHCLMDDCGQIVKKAQVHIGAYDICEEDWIATRTARHRQIFFHPGYNPKTNDNDVALVRFRKKINFGAKARSIALPSEEATRDCKVLEHDTDYIKIAREECEYYEEEYEYEDYDYSEEEKEDGAEEYDVDYDEYDYYDDTETGKEMETSSSDDKIEYDYEYKDNCTTYYDGMWATVVGWGATYKFDGSCILRKASKKLYPNHDNLCLDEDDYVLDEDKVCAYNPNWDSDSCQGDSGSGLVVHSKTTGPVLVGIVSYGEECGKDNSPGIYARVQHFTKWIQQVMDEYQ